ncbi:hypothetical protein RhiirA5_432808 [Rhizophagus irregularis]|uniref:Uncharacterized protein n=1 Tax=Rhizophagus irregularis TaxID=588596 RepID=A0A2N0NST4_9GLOM|nr:hypothetical protein RhiirA5_432808 [Rhizophagus irregularis]
MSSELELLRQRITELEAENAELRKENTEISGLRIKLSVSDAEIAELKRRNAEFLRANKEYNKRRDAENAKLRARIKEMESDSPSFNLVAVSEVITVPTNSAKHLNSKSLEEKDMDSFLLEAHKKIVSSEIKQHNKEKKFLLDFFKLLYGLNRRVEISTAEFSSLWARIFEWIRSIFWDT